MRSPKITNTEFADILFLLLAILAAIALALASGNYWSLQNVSKAMAPDKFEGGRGFVANSGLLFSSFFSAITGVVTTIYLIALFIRRAGAFDSWQRIVGYILLSPFYSVAPPSCMGQASFLMSFSSDAMPNC